MLRHALQRLVRLSPGIARKAWEALPERARRTLSPLVHPIAAGSRAGSMPLEVPRPASPARFDVVITEPERRAELEGSGHRVLDLGSRTPETLAQCEGALDAVLLTSSDDAALFRAAVHMGWRVAHSAADLEKCFPEVTVVIPTCAARDLCRSCLHGISSHTGWGRLGIVVVDDASSDGTEGMLRGMADAEPRISVLRLAERSGFARACNAGLELAAGEYVVLLNDDTVVGPGWLSRLVAHLERDPGLGAIGAVTNQIDNQARIETGYRSLDGMVELARRRAVEHAAERFTVPTLALFCTAMRLDLLREVGGLDARYEIGMFEDDDLSMMLGRRGFELAVARDAFVHHVGQATLGKLGDAEYLAIWEANKRRFEKKWGTAWRPPEG